MVVRVVFILVEPAGYSASAGTRAVGKVRSIFCPRTGEPFRRRFSPAIQRLQSWQRMRGGSRVDFLGRFLLRKAGTQEKWYSSVSVEVGSAANALGACIAFYLLVSQIRFP